MDKIRLVGGPLDGMTLQADELPSSRMYICGHLYIWNKHLDIKNYREFVYTEIKALNE